MQDQLNKNAVAAIRVSTTKQGTDGDSPEAQKEQIERFVESRGIVIKKFFVFLESASKEQQPMQEAIDYCKNPTNGIELFIIKSIDRFTRGGSDFYGPLKRQLEQCNVSLVDIYGVISAQKVNTLDHLGFQYKWSVYSPSKKSEILEAERAQDELRDIMSRMIGAEIRYTQMGFWMRQPPYGFVSEKIETRNGKRCVLRPHPVEAEYVIKAFELRAQGILFDTQIVEEINNMGYTGRVHYVHSKQDRTRVINKRGGVPLTVKQLQRMISNPIYAGVNTEKWTGGTPVQCAFDGLVSLEQFNRANKGKKIFTKDEQGDIVIYNKPPEARYAIAKGIRNPDFPYRKFVMCPQCDKPLIGSASRGKSGKYYPAYHCDKRGHYFRIPKQELEATVAEFIGSLQVSQDHIDDVVAVIKADWQKRQRSLEQELETLESHIKGLQLETKETANKIKFVTNETTIKYIEEDIMRLEKQIEGLSAEKAKKEHKKLINFNVVLARVRYLAEHLDYLLARQADPVKKAQFFAAVFNKLPNYGNLKNGTPEAAQFTGVNPIFSLLKLPRGQMVTSVSMRWNTLYPSLEKLHLKLQDIGCISHNDTGIVIKTEREE
jgi:site-specific DNA recombinase